MQHLFQQLWSERGVCLDNSTLSAKSTPIVALYPCENWLWTYRLTIAVFPTPDTPMTKILRRRSLPSLAEAAFDMGRARLLMKQGRRWCYIYTYIYIYIYIYIYADHARCNSMVEQAPKKSVAKLHNAIGKCWSAIVVRVRRAGDAWRRRHCDWLTTHLKKLRIVRKLNWNCN